MLIYVWEITLIADSIWTHKILHMVPTKWYFATKIWVAKSFSFILIEIYTNKFSYKKLVVKSYFKLPNILF